MVDDQPDAIDAAPPDADAPASRVTWATMWQVPTIVVSLVLIALGLYVAGERSPELDLSSWLDRAEHNIATGEYEAAAHILNEVIHPNRHMATSAEEGRFHRAVADWLYLTQREGSFDDRDANQRIADRYSMAQELLGQLGAVRLERWVMTLLSLNDLEGARQREASLEAIVRQDESVRGIRNRVARNIAEYAYSRPGLTYEERMERLGEYRASRDLAAADEAWAVARQAELRLETGRNEKAIARLLLDMRRLEQRHGVDSSVPFGELYTLLGQAYYNTGEYDYAEFHLANALDAFSGAENEKGQALVLLGHIAIVDDRFDEAFDYYDRVVRDFQATSSHLESLLSRGHINSVLSRHDQAEDDFRSLLDLQKSARPDHRLELQHIIDVLVDRHDAALATDDLRQALAYAEIAAEFYDDPADAPEDVLLRLAATSRQIADNLIGEALSDDWRLMELKQVDPALRAEANSYYQRAGRNYIQHARQLAPLPGADEQWADSLWMAADSYDLSGMHEQAIVHFREYIEGRAADDPRRPEALFRLAQAYRASLEYEDAASTYAQVIDQNPRSPYAARSYVPLAQCYLALDRRAEAEQELIEVIKGNRPLEPDAVDYREAQIALGRLYYNNGQYVRAIEELDRALKRYPGDHRANETRFRLAYSYLKQAQNLSERMDRPTIARAEVRELSERRRQYLTRAKNLFGEVREGYRRLGERRLDQRQQDYLRYAYLYRADCAFELADDLPEMYERAIELYDRAAREYVDHHISMVALIQIVACYQNLDDEDRARTAHRRAMVRLAQLPDDAFDEPDALLGRDAWERWLRHMPLGEGAVAAADRP